MAKLFIEDLNCSGKKVLMRVDFNVPLDENQNVTDDTRITAAIPSIKYIINNGGIAILMSHLGRPKGKVNESLRLKPAADKLSQLMNRKVQYVKDCIGPEVEQAVKNLKLGDILLLENLRFYKEEEENDPDFSAKLAKAGDLYVNDAFGTAHRAHASTAGVTKFFRQCAAGYLMKKEIEFLGDAMQNPKKPFVTILGGAKVSSKLGVIKALLGKVDCLLIGGGMSYTFLKALGQGVGKSLLEEDLVDTARELMREAKQKGVEFIIPEDYLVADDFKNDANRKVVDLDQIPDTWQGMDIGPKTIQIFKTVIAGAKTIFWNGPLGVFEMPNFATGTFEIAKAVANSGAVTIIGGGDSISAVNKAGVEDKITHISTGGGASLEYIEQGTLPGLEALTDK